VILNDSIAVVFRNRRRSAPNCTWRAQLHPKNCEIIRNFIRSGSFRTS